MSKIVYIIGPYSGTNAWHRENNIARAEFLCHDLWHEGIAAVCVHTMARYFHGSIPEETAIAIDDAILERCDAAITVAGWHVSVGSIREVELCEKLGKPVFHTIEDCILWAKLPDDKPDPAAERDEARRDLCLAWAAEYGAQDEVGRFARKEWGIEVARSLWPRERLRAMFAESFFDNEDIDESVDRAVAMMEEP